MDLIQKHSGVYSAIENVVPLSILKDGPYDPMLEERKQIKLDIMSRNRYKWNHQCDKSSKLDPERFITEVLDKLRPYFYPLADILKFYQRGEKHSHESDQHQKHESQHDGQLEHFHIEG